MDKIGDEEYQEMKADERHDAILRSLKSIADKPIPNLDQALERLTSALSAKKDTVVNVDTKAITDILTEIKQIVSAKPKSFTIKRSGIGLIEKIIPEY